jgi:CDP-diglyceride synthetase
MAAPTFRNMREFRMFYRAPMQPVLILELLILLALANGTPVVAKRLFGRKLGQPLDRGTMFRDGRTWFGTSKTVRGIVLAVLATTGAASLLGLGWKTGTLVGATAMVGDLFASFVKRRLGLISSSQAIGRFQSLSSPAAC